MTSSFKHLSVLSPLCEFSPSVRPNLALWPHGGRGCWNRLVSQSRKGQPAQRRAEPPKSTRHELHALVWIESVRILNHPPDRKPLFATRSDQQLHITHLLVQQRYLLR